MSKACWQPSTAKKRDELVAEVGVKASRGFEPRSLDSESRVLTVTPRSRAYILCYKIQRVRSATTCLGKKRGLWARCKTWPRPAALAGLVAEKHDL